MKKKTTLVTFVNVFEDSGKFYIKFIHENNQQATIDS